MAVAVVNQMGMLELPAEVQKQLDLHVGDKLEVRIEGNVLHLERKKVDILDLAGRFATKGKIASSDEIERAIEDGWAGVR